MHSNWRKKLFHLHVARGGKGKGGRESANPRFLIIFRHELCAVRGADSGFAMNIMSVASCNLSVSTGDQIELSAKEATESEWL